MHADQHVTGQDGMERGRMEQRGQNRTEMGVSVGLWAVDGLGKVCVVS
jgi:hypothetical protein